MDKRTLFEIWAPATSPWSTWAKPAPFAHYCGQLDTSVPRPPIGTSMVPSASTCCALVVVLPGIDAVTFGIELAGIGYRPVPLFNSCPLPPEESPILNRCAVDAAGVIAKLASNAAALAGCPIPADAPPAFLIDANRAANGVSIKDEIFDNRSVVFAADFPSATFLRHHGVRHAMIVHDPRIPLGDDLRYALRHWPAGGLAVGGLAVDGSPVELTWPSDGFWGELRQRLTVFFAMRRNVLGGFGAFVPESSGG